MGGQTKGRGKGREGRGETGKGAGRKGGKGEASGYAAGGAGGKGGGSKGGGKGGKGAGGRGARQELQLTGLPSEKEMVRVLTAPPIDVRSRAVLRPKRPGSGTLGAEVKLMVNRLLTTMKAHAYFYHYDVHVSNPPQDPPHEEASEEVRTDLTAVLDRSVLNGILSQVAKDNDWGHRWAYDGKKNIYSLDDKLKFPESGYMVTAKKEGKKPEVVHVQVTPVMTGFRIDPSLAFQFCAARDAAEVKGAGELKGADPAVAIHDRMVPVFEAVMALDVVLRHARGMTPNFLSFQTKLFPPQQNMLRMADGGEIWHGYHQSLRPAQGGLMLHVDNFTTGFISPDPIPKFCEKALKRNDDRVLRTKLSDRDFSTLHKRLKGLKVEVIHLRYARSFRCLGLSKSRKPANEDMFDHNGTQTSVAAYFSEKYRRVMYPLMPCLDLGSSGKARLVPMEFCKVKPDQRIRKPTPNQAKDIIKHAAVPPHERLEKTLSHISSISLDTDPTIQAFGLEVAPSMLQVPGRVLPPPHIEYGKGQSLKAKFGKWNLMDVQFFDPKPLINWAVVSYLPKQEAEASLQEFLKILMGCLKGCGMTANPPKAIKYDAGNNSAQELMQAAYQQAVGGDPRVPPQLILVVIPRNPSPLYSETKYMSDVKLGVPSQCVVAGKAGIAGPVDDPRARNQYCNNVCMKINAKLGGVNSVIRSEDEGFRKAPTKALGWFVNKPFMVFGADVTHAAPGSVAPSVAAVVGSLNLSATRYAARIMLQEERAQKASTEGITRMKDAVKELLLDFYRTNNKCKPERLLFYRDGVSEGEFNQVLRHEFPQIREACHELDPTYNPTITFMTVVKRHHTRFYPKSAEESDNGNMVPGTVIDTFVTHPYEFDFYLNSHSGIKGTNKCTHYYVLCDENGFSPDYLQLLTYRMCYSYNRATRSVSIVPAAYYAHQAAFRGRMLLCPEDDSDSDAQSVSSGVSGLSLASIHENLKMTMFYS
ncbi:hypothetical protein CYMTET_55286 [Cymbomonas tetramitiformis]|uniref:Uncharacterized protein n=1 Tax=Cymbomonas tetramitiformis TaxID=36881 RepID=A0AAE0BDB0_9CHLO|nr:hypothetical protein CYMTET_55286 [Cymbomonas tetramitiformis]